MIAIPIHIPLQLHPKVEDNVANHMINLPFGFLGVVFEDRPLTIILGMVLIIGRTTLYPCFQSKLLKYQKVEIHSHLKQIENGMFNQYSCSSKVCLKVPYCSIYSRMTIFVAGQIIRIHFAEKLSYLRIVTTIRTIIPVTSQWGR